MLHLEVERVLKWLTSNSHAFYNCLYISSLTGIVGVFSWELHLMLHMQLSDPNACLQALNWEYQIYPTRDVSLAIMGLQEELSQNFEMAGRFYKLSNHPIANQRYLAINHLEPLSIQQRGIQFITTNNSATAYPNTAPSYTNHVNTVMKTYNSKPADVQPKDQTKGLAKKLTKKITSTMAMVLQKLQAEKYCIIDEKVKVAQQLEIEFKSLNLAFKKCKKLGLVYRWPNISPLGIEVLSEYDKYRAAATEKSPEKAQVAKALLHMRELHQERNRRTPQANLEPAPSPQDKMRIKNLLN